MLGVLIQLVRQNLPAPHDLIRRSSADARTANPTRLTLIKFSPQKLARCDVPFFAVLVDVETLSLDLGGNAQTDQRIDNRRNDRSSNDRECDRDSDCLQ